MCHFAYTQYACTHGHVISEDSISFCDARITHPEGLAMFDAVNCVHATSEFDGFNEWVCGNCEEGEGGEDVGE